MTRAQNMAQKLHECMSRNDRARLDRLIAKPEFATEELTMDVFVDVVEGHFGNKYVEAFAKVANDDQLAMLLICCILYNDVYPLSDLFARMKDSNGAIERHHIKKLFLTVCDRMDYDAIKAMIDYKCFIPEDDRVVRTIFRREMDKSVVDEKTLRLILQTHPGHKETAQYLLYTCLPSVKSNKMQERCEALLMEYLG